MNELTNLQAEFQNYLMHSDQTIQQQIVDTEKVSAETRLAIYENAYRSRLQDALILSYPALQKQVGEDAFAELCHDYIDKYPSCFRSIRWYGDQFAAFLQDPFLSELAHVEWAMATVFDAADANPVSLAEIGAIPPDAWENMRFEIHPAATCLELNWNVIEIWQALSEDQTPNEPQESPAPVTWLLWRQDYQTQFCSLSAAEAWAVHSLFEERTFGEICEGLCQWIAEENAPMQAASFLKSWLTAGLITQVKLI